VVFNQLSTGAADDLARVTEIARSMVTRYGMSDDLGPTTLERDTRTFLTPAPLPESGAQRRYSETTAARIDEDVHRIVQAAFDHAVEILTARRETLERCARRLLEKETLEEAELIALAGDARSTVGACGSRADVSRIGNKPSG
jgi:cell division protease FtsH